MKTYAYDSANRLVEISDQSSVVSMDYNGLGQRLGMNAAGVIAHYVMDGNQPLTVTSENTTFYLYGLGPIAEKTNDWAYSLPDGTNTPRQLTNPNGGITLAGRYTPWGDILEVHGTGNFTFGYLGGMMNLASGLIYVGNGQYYDPSTGRFLTRDVNSNSTNPYVPWNPIGVIIGPLGLLSLFYSRKRKRSKWDVLIIMVLLGITAGVGVAACTPAPIPPAGSNNTSPTFPVTAQTPIPTGPVTIPSHMPSSTPSPVVIPTMTPCATPTGTPTLIPPPANPTEAQRIEYIASFGITLIGNWTGVILANLWEALFVHIGYQELKTWLNGGPATLIWGGSRDCGENANCFDTVARLPT